MRIKIVLPVFETNADLTEDEKVIYKLLSKTMLKSISEIAPYVPFVLVNQKQHSYWKRWEKKAWLQLREKAEEQNIELSERGMQQW